MDDAESPGLGLDLPETPQPKSSGASPYRLLARKYRPQSFAELIGQDAMVKTLANAIERGRIAHAFLLTGVRGVGKTSTARLIAKALNCIGPDGQGGPTINPCNVCEPCRAISEGRHIDVIEMDAASHTGIDDIREIIDAVRYASVSARYKIYIIDEVHMLSKAAFNALLKTLEEPPEHVKFLFATTEVNKVPVTVLSRCQRFDLRRIPAEKLAAHFGEVSTAEGIEVEPEALGMIARAAEGSARDGLSILDQAIAHGAGAVRAEQVRDMLGLADRGRIRRLLKLVLGGDSTAALGELDEAHDLGIDPTQLLRGLMESLHTATRAKVGAGLTREEFLAGVAAKKLGHVGLSESAALIALGLGLPIDEITETIEPVIAEKETDGVAPGRVLGLHQIAIVQAGDEVRVTLDLTMAVGAASPADSIEIDGDPPVRLTVTGGFHGDRATVGTVVNAVPFVVSAPPGLKTVVTLPLFGLAPLP